MNFVAKIPESQKQDLGSIRHWEHLKVARKDSYIWISGFRKEETTSNEVKCIPFIELYHESNSKLYPLGKKVPVASMESLIWTPIINAFPLEPIEFNHNLFEQGEKISWDLKRTSSQEPTSAIKMHINDLISYVQNAPKIRIQQLEWTLIDHETTLVIGGPPLSTRSIESYWLLSNHLIPLGMDFSLKVLVDELNPILKANNNDYVLWDKLGAYSVVSHESLEPLSRSSIRRSLDKINHE